jgi:signal transduction histidine kinase
MNDIELRPLSGFKPATVDREHAAEYMNRLLDMISAYKEGVWECDAQSGDIVFLNDYFGVLQLGRIGVEFSTLEQRRALIHPDDQTAVDVAFSCVTTTSTVRYRIIGTDGRQMWLRDNYYLSQGEEGSPTRVMCHTLNAEFEKCQQTQLLDLFNARTEFVFVFDRDFNIVDVVIPEGMRLFHSREDLIGSNGCQLYNGELAELIHANIRETLETGQTHTIEYHTDLFGKRYYWLTRMVPVGDYVYNVSEEIGHNIERLSELLEARKKAEDADRLKSAFLANMSHEIRTPLNAIVGFSQIVASEDDAGTRMGYMDIIRSNSDLLMQLISDILDLSRVESGKNEMTFADTRVNALLSDVEMTNKMKMPPGVELRMEYLPGERTVYTDRNRVTQILFNFLSNAIKNTERGSITVGVREQENFLRFSVADTGQGIAEDKLANVFRRFEKLNESIQGTGLGLAISQSLVERLGGEIGVESRIGEGSTFHFTIPYRQAAGEQSAQEGKKGRNRILVAEESDAAYRVVEQTLGEENDLIRVVNGEQALGAFIAGMPDMAILDIRMPVMNGIETARRIRAISATVPIVAVTRNDYYLEQRWALESGSNDVIFKPYSPARLREAVNNLL